MYLHITARIDVDETREYCHHWCYFLKKTYIEGEHHVQCNKYKNGWHPELHDFPKVMRRCPECKRDEVHPLLVVPDGAVMRSDGRWEVP